MSEQVTPLFDWETVGDRGYITTPPPVRRWCIEDVLPLGVQGLISGEGGASKSQFAIQFAICVAARYPLGLWTCGEDGDVLILFKEETEEEIHRRINCTCKALELTPEQEQRVSERCVIASLRGKASHLTAQPNSGSVTLTNAYAELLRALEGRRPKLIVLDPLALFNGGNENDNGAAAFFMDAALGGLAALTGASVLCVHHSNKNSRQLKDVADIASVAPRGASAFVDNARWHVHLAVMSEAQAKKLKGSVVADRKQYVSVEMAKNNYAPTSSGKLWFRRGLYGVLEPVDITSLAVNDAREVQKKVWDTLRSEAAANRYYSKKSFSDHFASRLGIPAGGQKKLREAVDELKRRGKLLEGKPPGGAVMIKSSRKVLLVESDLGVSPRNTPAAKQLPIDYGTTTEEAQASSI